MLAKSRMVGDRVDDLQPALVDENLQALCDRLPTPVWAVSASGEGVFFNKWWLELYGARTEECLGTGWHKFIHPDDMDRLNALFQSMQHNPQHFEIEHRIVRGDGQERTMIVIGKPDLGSTGAVLGYIGSSIDVTERRRATRARAESEARLRAILENTHSVVHAKDLDGRYILVNSKATEIFDRAENEILGKTDKDLFPAADAEIFTANDKMVLARNAPITVEESSVRDGERRFYIAVKFPLRDADGVTYGVGCMATDFSEQFHARAAIEEKNKMLAEYAEELKRSNADLEQFAYVASHDLQEPLRMVASYCQLLQKRYGERLDSDAREFIAFAVDGATRMQRLINDLLAYSRVGRKDTKFVPVNCEEVLDSVRKSLQGAIRESGAQIEASTLPTIMADPTQIWQLFHNLIGNALKFRGEQPPCIRVDVRRENAMWAFSVSDNGIGIDPRYKEKIFAIFSRLHGPTEFSGTGIGLAIAKKVIDRLGGKIWVESAPGQGSTFHFSLPEQSLEHGEENI